METLVCEMMNTIPCYCAFFATLAPSSKTFDLLTYFFPLLFSFISSFILSHPILITYITADKLHLDIANEIVKI